MLQLQYKRNSFPFQYPFQIAKGIKTHQDTIHVSLRLAALEGVGEASAIPYHNISVDDMAAILDAKRMMIERYSFIEPERFWHFLHHLIPNSPFVVAALDIAGWDLYGKMRKQAVHELMGLEWQNIPATDYTIGIATPQEVQERIMAHPHPIYKLKMGSEQDLEALKAARQVTDAKIRIDANESWNLDFAKRILPELETIGIELIEQPLAKDDIEGMRSLRQLTNIPIIADEACQGEQDLEWVAALYNGINVKLSKCSGLTPALSLIKAAKAKGLKIMLGCMSEGIVGCTALAHLLPLADYADLDGPLLLEDNTYSGMQIENGIISLSDGWGLGLNRREA